jgi:hypothetical protein
MVWSCWGHKLRCITDMRDSSERVFLHMLDQSFYSEKEGLKWDWSSEQRLSSAMTCNGQKLQGLEGSVERWDAMHDRQLAFSKRWRGRQAVQVIVTKLVMELPLDLPLYSTRALFFPAKPDAMSRERYCTATIKPSTDWLQRQIHGMVTQARTNGRTMHALRTGTGKACKRRRMENGNCGEEEERRATDESSAQTQGQGHDV